MPCPLCTPDASRVFLETELIRGLWDAYPVSPGHALLVPRRHIADWFEATEAEQQALMAAIADARAAIEARAATVGEHTPAGFNIGLNLGEAAGQTVPHLHLHVIPRYEGDVEDPRGGIRWVLPHKAPYWESGE